MQYTSEGWPRPRLKKIKKRKWGLLCRLVRLCKRRRHFLRPRTNTNTLKKNFRQLFLIFAYILNIVVLLIGKCSSTYGLVTTRFPAHQQVINLTRCQGNLTTKFLSTQKGDKKRVKYKRRDIVWLSSNFKRGYQNEYPAESCQILEGFTIFSPVNRDDSVSYVLSCLIQKQTIE